MYPVSYQLYLAVFLFVTNKKISCCMNISRKVFINLSKSRFYTAKYPTQNFRMIQKMLILRVSLLLLRPIKIHLPSKNMSRRLKVQNLPWVKKQYNLSALII